MLNSKLEKIIADLIRAEGNGETEQAVAVLEGVALNQFGLSAAKHLHLVLSESIPYFEHKKLCPECRAKK